MRFEVVKPSSCPSCATPTKSAAASAVANLISTPVKAPITSASPHLGDDGYPPRPGKMSSLTTPRTQMLGTDEQDDEINDEAVVGAEGEESEYVDPREKTRLKRQIEASLRRSGGIYIEGNEDDAPVKLGDWVGRPKK